MEVRGLTNKDKAMSVTKSKTAEHDADIKDNSHERAKLEAFAEAQALISKLPHETVLDTMSHEDMETQFERRSV